MISSGYEGCSYARILLPAFNNGFSTDKLSVRGERIPIDEIKKELDRADIVVLHRPEDPTYHEFAKHLKMRGKKIVVDNDDTFRIDDHHPLAVLDPKGNEVGLRMRAYWIDEFVKIADMVTVSTPYLAEEFKKINNNVVVLPNYIETLDWDEPLRNETNKVRIGIVGSTAIEYDYLHVRGVLRHLSERDDVELVMFGLGDKKHRIENPTVTKVFKEEYNFWDSLNIEQIPWCKVYEYPRRLNEARLDIMIIPRKNNYFNRCKSNIKFLEAAMCEIPVIAQSFEDGPYEEIKSGENGVLIRDNSKWMDEINNLINNKELRRQIGKNAREYVMENYDIAKNAYKWEEAYKTL